MQLQDDEDHGLYNLIGNTMIEFMKIHPQPFPNALFSKSDFWLVEQFKRAQLFVFLSRFVLEMPAQKPWDRFLEKDLKFNMRAFRRFTVKEKDVFDHSTQFLGLSDEYEKNTTKKRKRVVIDLLSDPCTESPVKRHFTVGDTSTDDEE